MDKTIQIDTFARFTRVSRETITSLAKYENMLINDNKNINLIGKSTINEIWKRHFLDSAQVIDFIDKNDKTLVDIGSGAGFPGLVLAIMLKDRKILKIAENFFKKGKLNHKIKIYQGYALDNLKKLHKQKRKFELIFIDADKANYKNYYDLSLNLLQKNGFIIFDNVLWKGNVINNNINDKNTNVIRNFNKYIKNDFKIDKIIIPLGDGLTICRKLK